MHRRSTNRTTDTAPLLCLTNVSFITSEGRPLFSDLNMVLSNEKVAVIGRNGVGKSTLLNIMTGHLKPNSGKVSFRSRPYIVPQQIKKKTESDYHSLIALLPDKLLRSELNEAGFNNLSELYYADNLSNGKKRTLDLLVAKLICPDLLLLDEPTEDLDENGVSWLIRWISTWQNGLLAVSHDQELLSHFNHFFIVEESGCSYFSGTYNDVCNYIEERNVNKENKYIRKLQVLAEKEEHRAKVLRKRHRKKNYGRISELERCTPKSRLNKKKSMAQESQGRMAKLSEQRIKVHRELALANRRSLTVRLPFELPVPKFDNTDSKALIRLESVSVEFNQRPLFKDLDLSIGFEKLAVVGPNGSGKTTFLNIITGKTKPHSGHVKSTCRFGYIEQEALNWMVEESLLELLMTYSTCETVDKVIQILLMHKFPIALAERPLYSLSPGERVRAALICLFMQTPGIQVLVLDEPTYSLDFIGEISLRTALKAWPGALIVASHRKNFLSSIGISRKLVLGRDAGYLNPV